MAKRAESKLTRSQLREVCKAPGCESPVYELWGTKRAHCRDHLARNAAREFERRSRLKAEEKCRCGNKAFPKMKRCFRCAFGIEQEKVEDWVALLETNPRLFDRMLRVLGGS